MKDIKSELVSLANHLDKLGLNKEADFIDNLVKKASRASSLSGTEDRLPTKVAGGPAEYTGGTPSRGQQLFIEAMQAYYNAIDTSMRNWYSGDDQEVAQRVIDAAQKYFDNNEYGPDLPKNIIQAGMYVEAGPATMGDDWQGSRSLFQGALEGGSMAGPWLFAGLFQNAAEMPTKLWSLFKAENERRYKDAEAKKKTAPTTSPARSTPSGSSETEESEAERVRRLMGRR